LYQFAVEILRSVRKDMAEGKPVAASRLHLLGRIAPQLTTLKEYEDATKKGGPANEQPLTREECIALLDKRIRGEADEK
ncbi:MAG: hypothetical protein GX410_01790, partial [Elusimicrobia bacterium]|nr:hypothetical protein [Elusimicrobiota bacterium]